MMKSPQLIRQVILPCIILASVPPLVRFAVMDSEISALEKANFRRVA